MMTRALQVDRSDLSMNRLYDEVRCSRLAIEYVSIIFWGGFRFFLAEINDQIFLAIYFLDHELIDATIVMIGFTCLCMR